jgi:ABC-type antimicrobial peptide transport system permease subunit
MALGAQQKGVLWLVTRDVALMLSVGTILGAAIALALERLVTSLLFGVKPNDPATLAAAAGALAIAAILGACVPARRAAHLDPRLALRNEQ